MSHYLGYELNFDFLYHENHSTLGRHHHHMSLWGVESEIKPLWLLLAMIHTVESEIPP